MRVILRTASWRLSVPESRTYRPKTRACVPASRGWPWGGVPGAATHHDRVGKRLSDRAIRDLEDHDGGPLPAESREAGAGQAFAGRRVKDIVIGDSHALLPAGIEHG